MKHWVTRARAAGIGLALAAGLIGTASANPLNFSYMGQDSSGVAQNLTFSLDSNPTPNSASSYSATFNNIPATYNGVSYSTDSILFYTQNDGGGFSFSPSGQSNLIIEDGAQVFSNTTAAPQFAPGSFSETNYPSGTNGGGTLTITGAAAPGAPGPVLGLGLLPALAAFAALALTRRRAATG